MKTGLHTDLGQDTPMCNLYLDMLNRVGIKEDRFGDSTGKLGILS